MNSTRILTSLAIVAGLAGDTHAGPYLFSFSGEAVPLTDNDALTGAWVEFSFVIDSDAIPDDHFVGGECEVASYSSSILEPTLTISGSLASDGKYDAEGPFTMTVADTDTNFEDVVSISQSFDGLFPVPGTPGTGFFALMQDLSASILTGAEVPIDITLDDFDNVGYFLTSPDGRLNILYKLDDIGLTITPVPEPGTLVILAFSAVSLARRRRMRA